MIYNVVVLYAIQQSESVVGGGGLVTKLCPTLVTQRTVAHQAPMSMGFPRQEYWSGLPFPFPRDLPDPEIKPCVGRWILYQLSYQGSPESVTHIQISLFFRLFSHVGHYRPFHRVSCANTVDPYYLFFV